MRYFESIYDRFISKLPPESDTRTIKTINKGVGYDYNRRHNFTKADVANMKKLKKQGLSLDAIAKMYGCSQPTVSKTILGVRFAHQQKARKERLAK